MTLGEFYCKGLTAPVIVEIKRDDVVFARVYDIRGRSDPERCWRFRRRKRSNSAKRHDCLRSDGRLAARGGGPGLGSDHPRKSFTGECAPCRQPKLA